MFQPARSEHIVWLKTSQYRHINSRSSRRFNSKIKAYAGNEYSKINIYLREYGYQCDVGRPYIKRCVTLLNASLILYGYYNVEENMDINLRKLAYLLQEVMEVSKLENTFLIARNHDR